MDMLTGHILGVQRMGHQITAGELDAWLNADTELWRIYASSHDVVEDKKFEVQIRFPNMFRVTSHGLLRYLGDDKLAAIHAYNTA